MYECGNTSETNPELSFHDFPSKKKAKLRKEWETRVKREDWAPTKFSHVCSKHFLPSDFPKPNPDTPVEFRKNRLKQGAVPSLSLRGKLQSEDINEKRTTKTSQRARSNETNDFPMCSSSLSQSTSGSLPDSMDICNDSVVIENDLHCLVDSLRRNLQLAQGKIDCLEKELHDLRGKQFCFKISLMNKFCSIQI